MKTVLRILAMLVLTLVLVSLTKCTDDRRDQNNDKEVVVDFDRQRNDVKEELRNVRNDIDRQLEKINTRIKLSSKDKSDNKDRFTLEKANRDLSTERSKIDQSLKDVENASKDTWQDVKVGAQNTTRDVKAAFRKMGNDLETFFNDKDTKD